jgi:3-oxoacyl-[acyl-carrier protein] reductase
MTVEIDLTGRVIPVTGIRGGLATATADWLTKAGAIVVGLDLPPKNGGEVPANFYPVDVTNQVAVEAAFADITKKFGSVDGLVHCAGITADSYALKMTLEQFERVIRVNQTGTFICMQAAANQIKIHGNGGRIVLFGSVAGKGNPGQINYAGAKAAVEAMANTAAFEWGKRFGINVNVIAPGPVETDMLKTVPPEMVKNWIADSALGRLPTPDEIAKMVLVLVSDLSSGVTGLTIPVSCGITFP